MNRIRDRGKDSYFAWLCRVVGVFPGGERRGYVDLLWQLHSIPFRYSILQDINRLKDGLSLRERYEVYTGEELYSEDVNWPCSVLEVLVALADKFAKNVLGDDENGQLTIKWFWRMIDNLGLAIYDHGKADHMVVRNVIEKWLDRDFRDNGIGSPFPIKRPFTDQRKIEIWAQINHYLNENLDLESYI